jgi:cold shock CspA family protein
MSSASETVPEECQTGCVKWFNNKAGYGFLTTSEGDGAGDDIFVHHSAIKVSHEQYKYLVQGEYVSFTKISTDNQKHAFQAGNVTGMGGHKLMCETRNAMREQPGSGSEGDTQNWNGARNTEPRNDGSRRRQWGSSIPVLVRGQGPREADEEWMLVRRKRHANSNSQDSRNIPQHNHAPSHPRGDETMMNEEFDG